MFDEVYVKKALLFHGGSVFDKALNHPAMLAKSVLGVMVESLLGGPTFLSKMPPVTQLNSEFMLDEISKTIAAIEAVNGEVKVLICDNNRVNQKLFKIMDAVSDKPWLTKAGCYLLFDFVHLLKSLRNNWLTERSKELLFYDNGVAKVAKWVHLETLFNYESVSSLTKLSKLDEVSVYPKPIERQKVSTCLKIFCEESRSALLLHPEMANVEGKEDTASFINMDVTFFRIVNVKSKGADIRHNNPLEGVITNEDDECLKFLCRFGDMALQMKPSSGRIRQLTVDTAKAIFQTCHGIVDLCIHLLSTSHQYAFYLPSV